MSAPLLRLAPEPSGVEPFELFDLACIAEPSGTLYVAEIAQRLGRPIARLWLLTGVPAGGQRGGHGHKRQAQYLVGVQGSVEVRLESCGAVASVRIEPGRGLYVPPGYWVDLLNFSGGAILAALSADPYDEDDYVRDRAAFRRWEAGF